MLSLAIESFDFDNLPMTPFPVGTYVVLHQGKLPAGGFVLSDVKIVPGWPNPVIETCVKDPIFLEGGPSVWLNAIQTLSATNDRPDFNMGVYQVNGRNYPVAVYGVMEAWPGSQSQHKRFRDYLRTLPEAFQHVAHVF